MNTSNAEFLATKGGQAATGSQTDSNPSPTKQSAPEMIGAEMLVHALHAEGVEYVWGYPGVRFSLSTTRSSNKISSNTFWFVTNRPRFMQPMATREPLVRWVWHWSLPALE